MSINLLLTGICYSVSMGIALPSLLASSDLSDSFEEEEDSSEDWDSLSPAFSKDNVAINDTQNWNYEECLTAYYNEPCKELTIAFNENALSLLQGGLDEYNLSELRSLEKGLTTLEKELTKTRDKINKIKNREREINHETNFYNKKIKIEEAKYKNIQKKRIKQTRKLEKLIKNIAFKELTIQNVINKIANEHGDHVKVRILLPDGIDTIEAGLFCGCENLQKIVIPSSVTSVKQYAFAGCKTLDEVTFAGKDICIAPKAFRDCLSLSKILFSEEDTVRIKTQSDSFCNSQNNYRKILNIKIRAKNIKLEHLFFESLPESLQSLSMPHAEKICLDKRDCEHYMTKRQFDIPPHAKIVTPLQNEIKLNLLMGSKDYSIKAFQKMFQKGDGFPEESAILKNARRNLPNCYTVAQDPKTHIIKLTFKENAIPLIQHNRIFSSCSTNFMLGEAINPAKDSWRDRVTNAIEDAKDNDFIPQIEKELHKKYGEDVKIAVQIPEGVTAIGDYAFCRSQNISTITLPDTVTSIGVGAFSECSALQEITIPEKVTTIQYETFSDCESLEKVNFLGKITDIEEGAFEYCPKLKSLVLPNTITAIGNRAFLDCLSLQEVHKAPPQFVISMDVSLLDKYHLDVFEIPNPNGSLHIAEEAFSCCKSLKEVEIPAENLIVGRYAFEGCKNLSRFNINAKKITLDSSFFKNFPKSFCFSVPDALIVRLEESGLNRVPDTRQLIFVPAHSKIVYKDGMIHIALPFNKKDPS